MPWTLCDLIMHKTQCTIASCNSSVTCQRDYLGKNTLSRYHVDVGAMRSHQQLWSYIGPVWVICFHICISLTSSVASPICQEGQSERTFPILTFSSRFFLFFLIFPLFFLIFDNFFAVKGGTLPPLPLYWLRH